MNSGTEIRERSGPASSPESQADIDLQAVWHVLIIIVAGSAIALIPADVAPELIELTPQQPSRYGYTASLALFGLPLLRLGYWLLRRTDLVMARRACLTSLSIVLPVWCLLDVLLGRSFFTFPNTGAHIPWMFWGYAFDGTGFARSIPLEEFGFYLTGIAAILLLYIWSSEVWMSKYSHSDADRKADVDKRIAEGRPIINIHWGAIGTGAALFGTALLWKYFGPHNHHEGFPGYFLFLVLTAIIPISMFVRTVRPFVNWQAFSFTMVILMLVSLLWEVTLGIPYQYWGFQESQMLGIFVTAWSNLPIEEPLLWVAAAWLNVTSYEMIRIYLASGLSLSEFLGRLKATEAA